MLMPAPDVFDQGDWGPFTDRDPIKDIPYGGILYATDREPAREPGRFYQNDRWHVLRLGVARVTVGKEGMIWKEVRQISLLKERPEDYPLKVIDAREIGILVRSINVLTESLADRAQGQLPGEQFAANVNAKLATSKVKDIFIYVPGYPEEPLDQQRYSGDAEVRPQTRGAGAGPNWRPADLDVPRGLHPEAAQGFSRDAY
jgi:hypothetical protein